MYFQEPTSEQENDHNSNPFYCVCGSGKRRSPSSSLSPIQQNPKREKQHSSSSGFPEFPSLRRCNSDPVPLIPQGNADVAARTGPTDVETPSPVRAESAASRRRRRNGRLGRSVSAPEKDLVGPIAESPNSLRLKMMKERMKEISKWCDEVIAEGDEEGEDEGEDHFHLIGAEVVNHEAPKDDENEGSKSEEEAVSVEKNGDRLIIHMRCPCSKVYQFLLSGNNCYYKLM